MQTRLPRPISATARHALIVAAFALLLSSLPYLAGYAAQTPDRLFDGAVFAERDYHSHLAKMQQGLRGEWMYRLLFTPEDHDGALVQTFYVALGHLARWLGLSLPLTYHMARLVFGALFFLAAYRFIAAFRPPDPARRIAFTLVAFSSGLGWLTQILAPAPPSGTSPIDFWLIDANSFFAVMMFPHFPAATALLLALFKRFVDRLITVESQLRVLPLRDYLSTALISFLLTLIHPYAIAILIGPVIVYGAMRLLRRHALPGGWWPLAVAALAGSLPVVIYQASLFSSAPVFRGWAAQNTTLSPSPIYYVLGYGPVLILALAGVRRFVREAGEAAIFTLSWIGVTCLLIYAPIALQRRFIEGMQVALCLIAGYGLLALAERWPARVRFVAVSLILVMAALSNVYMVIGYSAALASGSGPLFNPSDLVAAIDWLGAHSAWTDTVLASESTGGLIPARIGHRVVLGHWMETIHYAERQRDVAAFFDVPEDISDAGRIEILTRLGVRYVVHGDDERALGGFDPSNVEYLSRTFTSGNVSIYAVTRPAAQTSGP